MVMGFSGFRALEDVLGRPLGHYIFFLPYWA